ncbi:MAG: hypothetical protein AAF466_00110 [Bacteroidota bacterium]
MKKIILFVCFIAFSLVLHAQKEVTVPDATNFDSSAGSESSVNQSNGKLNISLNLVSLKGFKDMNATFGISYDGSMVVKNATATNEYAPQGVLGLGWSTSFSRIMADNKRTAARDDDTYYLFEGGLNELIAINKTTSRIDFKTKTHKPWKVYFYPLQEKWEVVKENGYTYTYDNVDWSVYWENWIGDSNQSGASRQGSSWNLTKVEDLYGNEMRYEYMNVEQSLINTGSVKHTEATYLEKIIGPLGEEIRLIYANKTSGEYYRPNNAIAEPDAYQEIYEQKYLTEVQVYDSSSQLLYKYDLQYHTMGSSEFKKRLLDKIVLINSNNDQQTFREFEYDEDTNSDFFGTLQHQILPTKGRVSYQYANQEIDIDQVYDITIGTNDSFFVEKDYILRLTGTNDLYMLTWNGQTWNEEMIADIPSGSVQGDYKSIPVITRENFFLVLHGGSPDTVILGGREGNGKTWKIGTTSFHHPGVSGLLEMRMMSGNDFCAIGNPASDRIYFYRWDGKHWEIELKQTSATGDYYYAGTNNYVIQNKRQSGQDVIKLHYYDITGELQTKTINAGFSTTGSIGAHNYWYAQNSFASVNANNNPEYVIRWDANYNYVGKDTPYGYQPDDIKTFGFYNNYFSVTDDLGWGSSTYTYTARYQGNGQWEDKGVLSAPFKDDLVLTGFGNDIFTHPANATWGNSRIHVFNANTGLWQTNNYSANGGGIPNEDKMSFDVFAGRYIFANRRLYRLNKTLTISGLSNYPYNTILTKTDGGKLLYLSSRNGSQSAGSAFAKVLMVNRDREIIEHNIQSDYYLYENPYENYPTHAIGYETFIVKDNNSSTGKIYKVIDGSIDFDPATGETMYKDYVIAKETYDPVLTRKQRNYYCYNEPAISHDNMRVHYGAVAQLNDVDGILGKTLTNYDNGETDVRRTGLPLKIRQYDSEENLVGEQENEWDVVEVDWPSEVGPGTTYYINMSKKTNKSYEGDDEISTTEEYEHDFVTGLQTSITTSDSEGNEDTLETTYLFQEFPAVENDNLLSPVIYNRSSSQKVMEPVVYKAASAVEWDLTGVPVPKDSYQWDGTGGSSGVQYDFQGGSNTDYRYTKTIELVDGYGNVLQEKNRSEVTLAYIYGYQGKRLVAKIDGATYNDAIALVNTSVINNPSSDTQLRNELQLIRDGLGDAFVTSYTFHPAVGLTSETDPRGRTTFYVYDDFYRLDHVKDNEGNIIKKNVYQYRSAPFVYSAESTDLPDCSEIGIGIGGGGDPDPITLSVVKLFDTGNTVTFEVSASDGGSYAWQWNHNQTSGNPSSFNIQELFGGKQLKITSLQCEAGSFAVQAFVNLTGGPSVYSNTVNHSFTQGQNCQ